MSRARDARGDAGFTLSEVLIAVVILAVAAVTMIGAIGSATFASKVHRDVVTVDSVLRQYAEELTAGPYVVDSHSPPAYPQMSDAPAGFRARTTIVECWNGASSNPMAFGGCAGGDNGVQRLTIEASLESGARAQTMNIMLRQR
jgi:prepilin-type N-terminal cleavage/methylation domain-containing protein